MTNHGAEVQGKVMVLFCCVVVARSRLPTWGSAPVPKHIIVSMQFDEHRALFPPPFLLGYCLGIPTTHTRFNTKRISLLPASMQTLPTYYQHFLIETCCFHQFAQSRPAGYSVHYHRLPIQFFSPRHSHFSLPPSKRRFDTQPFIIFTYYNLTRCQSIYYTQLLNKRFALTSLRDLCNLRIHFSWISNVQDAFKLQQFSAMPKLQCCAETVISCFASPPVVRPVSQRDALTERRLTKQTNLY